MIISLSLRQYNIVQLHDAIYTLFECLSAILQSSLDSVCVLLFWLRVSRKWVCIFSVLQSVSLSNLCSICNFVYCWVSVLWDAVCIYSTEQSRAVRVCLCSLTEQCCLLFCVYSDERLSSDVSMLFSMSLKSSRDVTLWAWVVLCWRYNHNTLKNACQHNILRFSDFFKHKILCYEIWKNDDILYIVCRPVIQTQHIVLISHSEMVNIYIMAGSSS